MLKTLKKERVFTFATSLFAFTFALGPFLMSLGLGCFLFISLFHFGKHRLTKREILFLAGYCTLFLLYLVGVFNTPYVDRGTTLLIRVIPIFIVPVFIILTEASKKIDYKSVRQFFIYGTLLSCIISIVTAIYKLINGASYSKILYFDFAETVHLHPSYYALYIITALVFLLGLKTAILSRLKVYIALIFVVALILLQSKIALLLFVILVILAFIRAWFMKIKSEIVSIGILLLIFLLGTLVMKGGRLNELLKEREKVEIGTFNEDGFSQRLWLWSTAKEHLQEKPFLGFGLGAQEKLFRHKVAKETLKKDLSPEYVKAIKSISTLNMHNNYIQLWYELGLIGLLAFVFGIIIVIIEGLRKRNYQALLIYAIFLIMLGVEVMLNRQMGIYYLAFIPALLLLESSKKSSDEI